MTNCKTAKRLLREWSQQVQYADMNNWQSVFFGKREIDKHRKRCKKCKEVKNAR